MSQLNGLTLGSLFDGIGGFPYAASFYGIKALWASEILPSAVSVTRRHFPDMLQVGDITQLQGGKLPPVDIISFGSPCQGLSMAGRRLGLADERSGLFIEAIRIIREMKEATDGKYPQIALWENVPGAFSSAGGTDFKAVLEAFTASKIPVPQSQKWANAGMVRGRGVDIAWCVYNAQYFGTAQRRRRIFLIADFGGERSGEILFVPKSLRRYFEEGGTPRQDFAAHAFRGADGTVEILNDQGGNSLSVEKRDHSPTLRSQTHGNLPIVAQPMNTRKLLDPIGFGGYNNDLTRDKAATLGNTYPHSHNGQSRNSIEKVTCAATKQANAEILDNRSPTIVAGHEHPYIARKVAIIPIHDKATRCNGGGSTRKGDGAGNGLGIGKVGDPAPTLTNGDRHAVAAVDCRNLKETGDLSGALQAKNAPGYSLNFQNPVRIQYAVRRLTPTECERLQGYPDGWTGFGHDGKPISDSRRYQMLGNSIAVPCAAYIMEGITAALNGKK